MAIAIGLCASAHGPRVLRAAALAAIPVASLSIYLTFSRFGVIATAISFLAAFAVSRNRWTLTINGLVAAGMSASAILITSQQSEIQNATGNDGAGAVIAILLLGVAALRQSRCSPRMPMAFGCLTWGPGPCATALVAVLAPVVLHAPISRGWVSSPTGSRERLHRTFHYPRRRPVRVLAGGVPGREDPGRGIGPGSFGSIGTAMERRRS